jgi:hypothetical protein
MTVRQREPVWELNPILIPRGIAHRPAEVSDDYLAVELKVSSTKLMPRTS